MVKPKIMHIIDRSISGGGAETTLFKFIRYLTDRFDFYVVVLGEKGGNSERYASLGIPVYEFGEKYKGKWNPFSIVEIIRIIKNEKIDLLHTWLFKSHMIGIVAARLTGVKILINDRSVILPENVRENLTHYFGSSFFTEIYVRLYRVAVRYADKVVVHTNEIKDRYIGEYYLPPNRMFVLPNGIDREVFLSRLSETDAKSHRQEILVPDDEKLIVMIGRLVPEKDWNTFFKIAETIKQLSNMSISFLVVGSGPDESVLRKSVKEMNLENVHFLGYREDIVSILQQSDVMVLTSRIESFPTVILEAMLVGCPVVATRITGPASILTDGSDGLLVPIGDVEAFTSQILHLLSDRDFCRSIVENARQTIREKYELKVIVDRLATLYGNMLR